MSGLAPIEVRRYGAQGPTVVVLHGGPGAPGSPAGLARALASDFAVLEPLQRRSGPAPLTVAQHVEDLATVAPKPATLIGWSWGAMLALSYAARRPGDVSALVLVGCGTYDLASRARLQRTLSERLGETGRHELEALQSRLASEQDPTTRDVLFGRIGVAIMRAESCDLVDDANACGEDVAIDEAGHAETWHDVLRLQTEGIEPAAFSAIRARVLMVHGDLDPHPGPATRDLLRCFLPQLEYVGLERCGHEPWRERHAREGFLELLREWIRR